MILISKVCKSLNAHYFANKIKWLIFQSMFVDLIQNKCQCLLNPMEHVGCEIDLGDIIYEPPRDGPTLWEIGIPDRSAAEFYVPDPNPKFINKLYIDHPDKLVILP
jgi:hypothetical protein